MPDYTVKDSQTGKTITFRWTGEQPPTEADMAQVFSEARQAPAAEQATPEESSLTLGNVARGAVKGAVGTFVGLGELVHQIPGVTKAVDTLYGTPGLSQQSFGEANQTVTPSNAGETVGKTAEQVGEFFIPVTKLAGAGKMAAKLPEVVKAGVLGAAQSEGSPTTGLATAALTAVLPGGGALKRAASALDESAEKSVVQALGATKEGAKATAAKLAPEMIARGVKGSREAMLTRATEMSQEAGRRLGAVYQAAGAAGKTVNGEAIRGELEFAKDALLETAANGSKIPIEGAGPVIEKLNRLGEFVEELGDDIPVDKAAKVKTVWDRIVAKSGLYGAKAAASATDSADAWATREATSAFRTALNAADPDIAALSKEYAFWTGLKGVLKQTQLRTQAQTGGLYGAIGTAAGAASGFASGQSLGDSFEKAFIGAAAGRSMVKLIQSPAWRTMVSAPLKAQLADALGSGVSTRVAGATSRILTALPPQVRAQFAQ